MTERLSPKRRGRPTRAEVSAKALADLDPAQVDPLAILRTIASDASAPAAARVAACKALLDRLGEKGGDNVTTLGSDAARLNARAAAIMRRAN
jgi:hypothetical protein